MSEQQIKASIEAILEEVCEEFEIGAEEPEPPLGGGALGTALYGGQLVAEAVVANLAGPVQNGITAALGILNGAAATLEAKISSAVDALYAGGVGSGPSEGGN